MVKNIISTIKRFADRS